MHLSSMTSQRKIEANRRNARHSTGPRRHHREGEFDPAGGNDGILTREVIVAESENWEQLKRIHQGFRNAWLPVGQMEEVLVEKITIAYWRMRRVLRAEAGDIGRQAYSIPSKVETRRVLMEVTGGPDKTSPEDDQKWSGLQQQRSAIPEPDFLHALAQYETVMERQFYRAIRTLERIQGMRLGEIGPPTAVIEYDGI